METIRLELSDLAPGITCTIICPFFINTGLFSGAKSWFLPNLSPEETAGEIFLALKRRYKQVFKNQFFLNFF